jgi:hypothetical protein
VALGSIGPQSALSLFDQPPSSHKAAKVAPPAKPAFASKIPAPKARFSAAPSKSGSGTAAAPVASAGPKLATASAVARGAAFKPKNDKPKQQLQVRCSLEKLQAERAEALAFLQELETGVPSLGGGNVVEVAPGSGGGGGGGEAARLDRSLGPL